MPDVGDGSQSISSSESGLFSFRSTFASFASFRASSWFADPQSVTLHVYDVGRGRFYGVYHLAIEIHGKEWSFGSSDQCGIFHCPPRRCPLHTYKQSVLLGECLVDKFELRNMLRGMRGQWMGPSYDLLHHNCCTFCSVLADKLGVGPLPKWVDRLAKTAAKIDKRLYYIDVMMANRINNLVRRIIYRRRRKRYAPYDHIIAAFFPKTPRRVTFSTSSS